MICMALNHRMSRLGGLNDPRSKTLAKNFYLHRGIALRSINEHLNAQHGRTSDVAIAGILTLLLTDVS